MNYAAFWEAHAIIDGTNRLSLLEAANADSGRFNAEEVGILDAAKSILAKFDSGEINTTKLEMRSRLLTASISKIITTNKKTKTQSVSNTVFGSVSCVVRGASADELVAYHMDFKSLLFQKHEYNKDTVEKRILENFNGHHAVFYFKVSLPHPFQCRDFVLSFVSQKLSATQQICVLYPTNHKGAEPSLGTVRGESTRVFRFTEINKAKKVTKFELFFR